MAVKEKIRIRLQSYDAQLIDAAAEKIVETAKHTLSLIHICRDARKNGGARSNGGERQMFDAVCAACGKACKVPFQPREDRPVYCSDCFARMKQN